MWNKRSSRIASSLIITLVALLSLVGQSSLSSPFDFLTSSLQDSDQSSQANSNRQQQQPQQQQQQHESNSANTFGFDFGFNTQNLSQILLHRFQHIFDGPDQVTKQLTNATSTDKEKLIALRPQFASDELTQVGPASELPLQAAASEHASENEANTSSQEDDLALENRKQELMEGFSRGEDLESRNYFRVLDRVFGRVELPDVFKTPARARGGFCALHLGCFDEVPNIPSLLKRVNVSSIFTLYTNRKGQYSSQKVIFEPKLHYQLEDANATESKVREKILDKLNPLQPQQQQHLQLSASSQRCQRGRQRLQAGSGGMGSLIATQCQTASSWRASVKIKRVQEYPFDLAALERSGFDPSLSTRVIIGGYFAKESEEWIDELVRQWQLLEPSNIIKVSWPDANRGLYHSAAYNSRIVSRQLTLLLHYLDQMFSLDLDRVHLVGHSLGAHIAGSVGADFEGRLARITGLDPAGPIFVDLNASMRLDPSDAKFVDVLHTNGGPITKGALGLSLPSGHVDYYCNGGSVQPGCMLSSVSKSIMDPVERVACNHRRSYRYFIEIIRLTVNERSSSNPSAQSSSFVSLEGTAETNSSELNRTGRQASQQLAKSSNRPRAFLFEAKLDELMKLIQPELLLVSGATMRRDMSSSSIDPPLPLNRRIEFHELKSNFPPGRRGLYFVRTRSEAPFFGKQYAVTIRTDNLIKRKIALTMRIDRTVVPEVELDEIAQVLTLTFVPNEPLQLNTSEPNKLPQLWLSWKYRSFSLLANQQNELYLSGVELLELDSDQADQQEPASVRYALGAPSNESQPTTTATLGLLGPQAAAFNGGEQLRRQLITNQAFVLARNRWHRFEARA